MPDNRPHKEGQKLTEQELNEWLGEGSEEKTEVEEPRIVTEIYKLGSKLGYALWRVEKDLSECVTALDTIMLLEQYAIQVEPMTEQEFDVWVKPRPAQTMDEIVQEIADNPGYMKTVELPYALKVEMLVRDMRGLLARQDALEHQIRHLVKPLESGIEMSPFDAHELAHNNLDADLTGLTNRVNELETTHQHDDT